MSIPGSASPLLLASTAAAAGGYQISRSLRFNSADSAYLSRTPAVAGNRQTWTWAGWVKRSAASAGARGVLFGAYGAGNNTDWFEFGFGGGVETDDSFYWTQSSVSGSSASLYRDFSAWYHIAVSYDGANIKVYVNNSLILTSAKTGNLGINGGWLHTIGTTPQLIGSRLFNGYLADIHFIDGQALTPSSFTEVSATTGQLIPKTYSGSYGLVADSTGALPIFNTTGAQGAVKDTGTRTDTNSASIVLAVPMDGTNGGTSFGDQSAVIRGSGSAKTVTVNGNTNTSTAQSKFYGSSGSFDGTGDYLSLSSSADFQIWNSTSWTVECFIYINSLASSFYFFGAGDRASTTTRVMFSFNSSGNFILDWDGTSSDSTTTFTTGLSANNWYHLAVVSNGTTCKVYINGAQASTTATLGTSTQANAPVSIAVPGLAANPATYNGLNGYIQDFRIYKGVAKYTSNFIVPTPNSFYLQFADNSSNTASTLGKDTSGNSNNWTPNNLSVTAGAGNDSLVDTPTSYGTDTGVGGEVRGNYCTLNPLVALSPATLSNGNLDVALNGSASYAIGARGTIAIPTSGKWYWEVTVTTVGELGIGVTDFQTGISSYYYRYDDGGWQNIYINDVQTAAVVGYTNNDVISIGYDADNSQIRWYKNGTQVGTNYSLTNNGRFLPFIKHGSFAGSAAAIANFGQRAFAYTAPSGFKALCDTNLGAPLIAKPNTLMDVVTRAGGGTTQTFATLRPGLVWEKRRDSTSSHYLFDVNRGNDKHLSSDTTSAEGSTAGAFTFNTNSYTVSSGFDWPGGATVVDWVWDAGSSTVSNTAGSITSQVRANASAGFSIVSWTATGSVSTVGHGLNAKPSLCIHKPRTGSYDWAVITDILNGSLQYLYLNSTQAVISTGWGSSPTSSVMSAYSYSAGQTMISYCFAPVVGYSSAFSFTGTGSTDGPLVWLGFRARMILLKRTDVSGDRWIIWDTARNTYNQMTDGLFPNLANAELNGYDIDVLASGFKMRDAESAVNASGGTYVGFAWAESPFQYARAR